MQEPMRFNLTCRAYVWTSIRSNGMCQAGMVEMIFADRNVFVNKRA